MRVGTRIRMARRDRHMTLAALAEASGLTKGFISQVESGSSGVSLASLERIATALAVPLASLLPPGGDNMPASVPDSSHEPVLVAARNLYQETTGLMQLAAAQNGAHFLASLPPRSLLSSPLEAQRGKRSEGIIIVLQGSLLMRHASNELRVSEGEVASWDCQRRYSIENSAHAPARILIFIPEGAPLPALSRMPAPSASQDHVAYSSTSQGPMRLVEMRARRLAERRR